MSAKVEAGKLCVGAEPGQSAGESALDERPHSVYERLTREMLEQVKEDVTEVKNRVNTLLWMLAGAIVLDLLMRLVK